jgi:hypothetical protein
MPSSLFTNAVNVDKANRVKVVVSLKDTDRSTSGELGGEVSEATVGTSWNGMPTSTRADVVKGRA